jgi:hypothetical protein
MTNPTTDGPDAATAPTVADAPTDESPKSILMNWILVAVGCGGVAGVATIVSELL